MMQHSFTTDFDNVENLESFIFDLETVFLNGDLVEEIFMNLTEVMKHKPD